MAPVSNYRNQQQKCVLFSVQVLVQLLQFFRSLCVYSIMILDIDHPMLIYVDYAGWNHINIGGVAQWLGCRSMAGGLFLPCARSMVKRWPVLCGQPVSAIGQLTRQTQPPSLLGR